MNDVSLVALLAALAAALGAVVAVVRAARVAPPPLDTPPSELLLLKEGVDAGLFVAVPALAIALDRVATRYIHPDAVSQLPTAGESVLSFVTSDAGYPQLTFNTTRIVLGLVDVGVVSVASAVALPLLAVLLGVAFVPITRSRVATATAVALALFGPTLHEFPGARATPFVLVLIALAMRAAWGPRTWSGVRPEVVAVAAIALATLDTPVVAGWLVVLAATESSPQARAAYRAALPPLVISVIPLVVRGVLEHRNIADGGGSAWEQLHAVAGQLHLWMLLVGTTVASRPRLRGVAALVLAVCALGMPLIELRKVVLFYLPLLAIAGVASLQARAWRVGPILIVLVALSSIANAYSAYLEERRERLARTDLIVSLRMQIPRRYPLAIWPSWVALPALVEAGAITMSHVGLTPTPRGYLTPDLPCERGDTESWHLTILSDDGSASPAWTEACAGCVSFPTIADGELRRCPPDLPP